VWLLRHGQTAWNLQRRYLSDTDLPLTPYGERQARAANAFFGHRKVDVIVHSGLARTAATATLIAAQHGAALVCDPRWREASHGAWEGLMYQQVVAQFPQEAKRRANNPLDAVPGGGESLRMAAERVYAAWSELGERYSHQRVLIVTHATPIQIILCQLTGIPLAEHWRWRVDLGSATGIDCYPGATILRAVNAIPRIEK
jgi:2,3-bisphosphoglycerate-dependent phosphoglycerate mutase/probable phosphoglycerate mutase